MSKKAIPVKATHITNLTDARYFAAKDVRWMSFDCTEGSSHFIPLPQAKAIIEWVEGPDMIAECDFQTAEDINRVVEWLSVTAVQVGMFTSPAIISDISTPTKFKNMVIEVFTNPDFLTQQLRGYAPYVQAFQLDFTKNNLDWSHLENPASMITVTDLDALCRSFPIILNIDFTVKDLETIVQLPLYGLSLRGGEEERVGVKSFDELDEIFDFMETFN